MRLPDYTSHPSPSLGAPKLSESPSPPPFWGIVHWVVGGATVVGGAGRVVGGAVVAGAGRVVGTAGSAVVAGVFAGRDVGGDPTGGVDGAVVEGPPGVDGTVLAGAVVEDLLVDGTVPPAPGIVWVALVAPPHATKASAAAANSARWVSCRRLITRFPFFRIGLTYGGRRRPD
jgi:hypothetical protein